MKRFALVLVAAAAAFAAITPTASAQSIELSGYCSFTVLVDLEGAQKLHDNGSLTGYTSATLTNASTGASVTYNISGPTIGGQFAVGPWLTGEPGAFLLLTRGRYEFPDLDPTTFHGSVIDVCAALS